ncbi:MAG: hypothetical protein WCI56_05810 [Hyphomicrobiales bacterium]
MRNLLLVLTGLFVLTVVAISMAAASENSRQTTASPAVTIDMSAAKQKVKRRYYSQQTRIACTPAGCHPVPANCKPVTAYFWDGRPTGFDAVACR